MRLSKKIEDLMSAVSFAEEGEFDTARQMLKEERRVLLAVGDGVINKKTLKYAVNTSKRIGADLDILMVSSAAQDAGAEDFVEELGREGIRFRVIRKRGCLKQGIVDYTNDEKDILFVVIESEDNLNLDCAGGNKRLSEAWQKLRCPLVVVMDGAKA